jgi:hypothetical protein
MERMSSMLRTQGIIKNEGGALDNLIHKKQKTVDKKMIARLFKMVDEQKRHYISIKEILQYILTFMILTVSHQIDER